MVVYVATITYADNTNEVLGTFSEQINATKYLENLLAMLAVELKKENELTAIVWKDNVCSVSYSEKALFGNVEVRVTYTTLDEPDTIEL